ncbi:type II secretion system protein [uncultured Campylobacter sp.]|uniref:type II secretion system protein n=1 Tax=uncultured Campylobacter sp. TaxID=218934 RepID=UPI0025D7CCC8|nr:type II secretion system protein [uncultured Campylobacter sp.]
MKQNYIARENKIEPAHSKRTNFFRAFTMIELIFVIVIIGILAAVAIPRLQASRDEAWAVAMATQIKTAVNDVINHVTATGNSNIKFKAYPIPSSLWGPVEATSSIGVEIAEDTYQLFPKGWATFSGGIQGTLVLPLDGAAVPIYSNKASMAFGKMCVYIASSNIDNVYFSPEHPARPGITIAAGNVGHIGGMMNDGEDRRCDILRSLLKKAFPTEVTPPGYHTTNFVDVPALPKAKF